MATDDSAIPLRRLGVPNDRWRDVYYFVLVQPWSVFYGLLIAFYVALNCLFATLYSFQPGCIAETHPGAWLEDFFFSVETIATVGFGVEHPVTAYAHWVVTAEILVAVLALPLATGLIIVKFARPHARITFSRNMIVTDYDGRRTLMFRLANVRANQIYEARINLTLLRYETTLEGRRIRRLITLHTVRDTNPMFFLSWTVMHRIDEQSPLFGLDWSSLRPGEIDIMAIVTGLDATTSTTVHARHLYGSAEILMDHMFEDIITSRDDGQVTIDYRKLDAVQPITARP
jgi:inward rectifier potassium channel